MTTTRNRRTVGNVVSRSPQSDSRQSDSRQSGSARTASPQSPMRRRLAAAMAGAMAGAAWLTSKDARAAVFRYRLGSSQPHDSPNGIRLKEMADRIRADTGGQLQIEVYPDGKLGSDSAMLDMVRRNELELYIAGNVLGPLVPVTELPGLPFIFKNTAQVFDALDGDLGDHIRAELRGTGLYAFRYAFDNGFHQFTSSTKPIRTVDDLAGMKIRTPVQKMTVDFFESLGAKPMTFTLNKLYQVLQDRTVDAQTDPLGLIVFMKLYEVQTYLSLSHHWWSGFTLLANLQAWHALPADLQAVVERHARAAALAQRQDIAGLDAAAVDLLRGKGMVVNEVDTAGFHKQLGAFYGRWKAVYGDKAWSLLENRVGRLV